MTRKWFAYPWSRSEVGRKGRCPFCGEDVAGGTIVAALVEANWAHEICALRAFVQHLTSDQSDVIQREGRQVDFLDAVKANVVPGVTHAHTRRKHVRFTWTETK